MSAATLLYWRAYLKIRCSCLNIILPEDDTNDHIIGNHEPKSAMFYLIKEAIVDSIYIPNSCADSAISPLEVPPLPDSLVSRIWYNTLRYIWLCSIKQQANRNVSICKPRLSLAHEVTPSVILRKCISKSFSPLSWFPRSVSFSSLRYREGKSLILTLNIYISSYKKKHNGFLRCINKINWSLFFF